MTNDDQYTLADTQLHRDLAALQPISMNELARRSGISPPNLNKFLQTGKETMLSTRLRMYLQRELGLTANAWIRPDAHVWRSNDVEAVIKALERVFPPKVSLSIGEVRRQDDFRVDRMALEQVYLVVGKVDQELVRILLQIEAAEGKAARVRRRLKECSRRIEPGSGIQVTVVERAEHERLSRLKSISEEEFDQISKKDAKMGWKDVLNEIKKASDAPEAVIDLLQGKLAGDKSLDAILDAIVKARGRAKR